MIKKILTKQFTYNYEVLKMNTDGLSEEDALVQPTNGGNSLNWVVAISLQQEMQILKYWIKNHFGMSKPYLYIKDALFLLVIRLKLFL